jgi:phosphoglycolate phosphatase-like HAD superfamily hydrolase
MINTLMERVGIESPKQVMKVGDTKADIQEGMVAHCCASIGVLTGVGTLKEFREVHADIVITSVMALEK